ncbi:S1-like domain-containing RNA-binding protein [Apilactobacillus sp. TMW 2.2459]|uniref:CvfB family protein n=1 Tax=Apilactobacillus xinyiensis TaxID=2841032 RepID=UPI00200D085C|nr:S1-like domain-containing RNA-binding protein [Apilactobacillus xinyiensis]MCL0311668.1 S1-like domain-containing RNA-binding protein [Apilactobacillus xinyiensis]MCL0329354.1 S1-like domain-containing RNA-binding protein [Apilactobacillus xinyiensis]
MNNILGKIVSGKVTDENDKRYFVQIEGETFFLDKKEIVKPLKLGSNFKGFAYENEDHKMQITRNAPKSQQDHYAFGTIVNSKFGLGVFVDIGLPNKDIAVSLDDLPTIKSLWPQRGDQVMIALKIDNKNRIWGELADEDVFKAISIPGNKNMMNFNLKATAFRLKLAGTKVLTDDYRIGFIHPSERELEPRLGERLSVRVIGVHPDGTLNLSMRPRAYEAISDDAKMLMAVLKNAEDFTIPYNDKSNPDDIKKFFGISKGQFKRAIGHLLKNRLIAQSENGTYLTDKGKEFDQ